MKRRLGAVAVVALALVFAWIALWWLRRDGAPTSPAPDHAIDRGAGIANTPGAAWSDPRTLPRASISGTVTDDAKAPIAGAQVCTNATGPALPSAVTRALTCTFTDQQGRYRIADLIAADYLVHASAKQFRSNAYRPAPGVDNHEFPLAPGEAKTGVDVELKRGGVEITGIVLDISGGLIAHAEGRDATRGSAHVGAAVDTDEQGRFSLWADGGNDMPRGLDASKQTAVTVHVGQTATVKLTVESQRGTITGTVVDVANQPVPDAFLSWAREFERAGSSRSDVASTRHDWRRDARPVLTAVDGSFQITGLEEGKYTLRAYRKGGGEGIAEHVAVGATARLQIKPTGSIAGAARRKGGSPPQELKVMLEDTATGFQRSESFYMTGGRFALTDLPAGHFDIVVEADGSQKAVTVDLREGEAKTGLDVELVPLVTVTGRLVEHGTQKPVRLRRHRNITALCDQGMPGVASVRACHRAARRRRGLRVAATVIARRSL